MREKKALAIVEGIPLIMKTYDDYLYEKLKDPEFAAEFLVAAADDEEPVVFLSALRKVAEVQGMAGVARKAGESP